MSKDGIEEIKPEYEKNISGGIKTSGTISEEFKEKIISTLMKRPALLKAYGGPKIKVKKVDDETMFLPKKSEE